MEPGPDVNNLVKQVESQIRSFGYYRAKRSFFTEPISYGEKIENGIKIYFVKMVPYLLIDLGL